MQTRLLGLMLLTGCYVPLSEPGTSPERAEHSTRDASATAPQCSDPGCSAETTRSETKRSASRVRTVKVEPPKPENQTLGITISIPTITVDCSDVLLAVVGARRAVLGERVVLEAAASGPMDEGAEDGYDYAAPTFLWESEDTEVTVVGPASAQVSCDTLGVHSVSVELAPPAPCPATLSFDIECVEANLQ